MDERKAAAMLGFAARAGRIASGETACEKALRSGRGYLTILSEDASGNTVKKFTALAGAAGIPLLRFSGKIELGRMIGKGERSCAVVTDEHFADVIMQHLQER